jgi:hypothetical protein
MQWTHLKRLLLDRCRLPLPIPTSLAHSSEPATHAHPGEGIEGEHSSWEADWIDLGGEG